MDPTYQAAMIQNLMGGVAQPGVMASGQNPTTAYGQSFITGNPTVPGGMLGASPYQTVNPMAPQMGGSMSGTGGMADPTQLMQPYQQYAGMQQQPGGLGGNGGQSN